MSDKKKIETAEDLFNAQLKVTEDLVEGYTHLTKAVTSLGEMVYEISKYSQKQDERMDELVKAVQRLESKP